MTRPFGISPDGHRLPGETRVGAVHLQVGDLGRSLDYYRDRLGLMLISSAPGMALMGSVDGSPLVELHEQRGTRPVPHAGVLGLFHFAILLPDRPSLGRFLTHLTASGVRAASADHAVSEAFYLWDPDGLGIEVYADRPRSEWRVNNGELVMVTEALDLASVARAAERQSWSGFPAGTRMGHMHLQVGDLEQARRFYHEELGFDITVWTYPGALFMSAGGYHHHLAVNVWAPHARPATGQDARLLEWELLVPDAGDDRVLVDPWGTQLRLRTHVPPLI